MGTLFVDWIFSIHFSRDVSFHTSTELKQAFHIGVAHMPQVQWRLPKGLDQ